MDSKIKKMARIGYIAKGVVYAITGVLAFMAAFNMGGGQASSKTGVVDFLQKQPFGNALLVLLALGLICYSGWRFFQAIKDPEHIGDSQNGKVKRAGLFVSGLLYLSLAGYAILKLINAAGSGGGNKTFSFLSGSFGVIVFAIIGIALIGSSIHKFQKAYKGEFLKKFHYASLTEEKRRKLIKNTGYLGILSRAVVFGILAFIFIRAAYHSNTNDIKNTKDAFSFLQNSAYGAWLLGLVAIGLICYGIYMFAMAKYREFDD